VRKVLLVTYTFPPQYDISARRAAKLCKYLPASGWRPIVLTKDWTTDVAPEDRRTYAVVSHPTAVDELTDVTVVRTPYQSHDNGLRRLHARLGGVYGPGPGERVSTGDVGQPQRSRANARASDRWTPTAIARRALSLASPLFGDFPDAFRGWLTHAVPVGTNVVRQESVDAIVSLCPPATAHVVASEIARATGVPWVAQFDDLYSFHLERQHPAWRRYSDRRHRRWMSQATLAGAITPAMLAYVHRTYGLDGDVVVVGFDPAESPRVDRARGDRLRLGYTGSVYPGDQRPEILFDALEQLIALDPRNAEAIEVTFLGTGRDEELRALLAGFPNAARVCVFKDRMPPEAALRAQREADGLLLLNCTAPSPEEGTLSFPAKTFEYLNAERPILAIPSDPGGWGDRLLEATGAGVTAASAREAAAVLARWVEEWRASGTLPYRGNRERIDEYSQPRQAAALARLLDRSVATGQPALPLSSAAQGLR